MTSPLLKTYVHLAELASRGQHPIDVVGTIADYIYRTHEKSSSSRRLIKAFTSLQYLHNFYGGMPPSLLSIQEDLLSRCLSMLTIDEKTAFAGVM